MDRETMKNKTDAQIIERAAETKLVHLPESQLMINDHPYKLLDNYRDAFDDLKLKARFSDILIKYDYIVGDIAADQLRLKGFYTVDRPNVNANQTIATLEDYLFEYVNFGAPYFVLQNLNPKMVSANRREPVTNRTKKRNRRPSSTSTKYAEKNNKATDKQQTGNSRKNKAANKVPEKGSTPTAKRTNNYSRNKRQRQAQANIKEVRTEVNDMKQTVSNNSVAITQKRHNHHKRHFTIKQKED
ncbi:uncharacterized protein YutD [Weissella beninensis]|uniref:YutD family protein n=1 Tax=Periweissella beninensis TaxID=504936 RepID=A0ABT0VI71_9LACO|nr:YutD family protein [Periweissella beninensis]MBM7544087.1 uncharacterized protein YutD [Periweissella beninensis]MCM2437538.1 YutD family protein [Periweissella beninensis]